MSTDATWTPSPAPDLWWLRRGEGNFDALGLLERRYAPPQWCVAQWSPRERRIAFLPADLPLEDAQNIARLLILAQVEG